MSGQPHVRVSLLLRKEPPVTTEQEAGKALEPGRSLWPKNKPAPAGNQTSIHWSSIPQQSHCRESVTPAPITLHINSVNVLYKLHSQSLHRCTSFLSCLTAHALFVCGSTNMDDKALPGAHSKFYYRATYTLRNTTRRTVYLHRDIQARSCNHCCR